MVNIIRNPNWPLIRSLLGVTTPFGSSQYGVVNIQNSPFNARNGQESTAAIQAAIDSVSSRFNSGIVFVPPGNPYSVSSTLTLPASVSLVGGGVGNTSIMTRNDVTVLKVDGDYAQVSNLTILGKGSNNDTGAFGATQPAVQMNGVEARMTHARVQGGTGIRVTIDDTYLDDVTAVESYGIGIVTCDAVTFMSRNKIDHAWPVSPPASATNFAAWAATTAYTVGTVVSVVSGATWYIQCRVAGTSGGSAPALKNFDIDIPDGSVMWRLVSRSDMDCLRLNANEFHGTSTDISGVGRSGILINGAGLTFLDQFIIGQQWGGSINADTGSSLYVDQCELNNGSNTDKAAVLVGGGWTGDLAITDCTIRSYGGAVGNSIGVDIGGGVDARIRGNNIKEMVTGVLVRANVNQFIIDSNSFTSCTRSVDVNAGTSDHYNIVNNLTNTSGAIVDGGAGANKTLSGNN